MDGTEDKAPLVCSQRLTLVILTFFGKLIVYSANVNLSLALLCMVRSDVTTNITSQRHPSIKYDVMFNSTSGGHDDNTFNGTTPQPPPNGSISIIGLFDDGDTSTFSVDEGGGGGGRRRGGGGGELDWNKSQQSHLLSMYFYGYILTQIPGGWMASRFGGKNLWGMCQLISGICTILTPACARTHLYLACAVRFLLGFVSGVTFPSVYTLMGKWAPPLDRSRMISISYAGTSVGIVLTLAISGFLCEFGFDSGWGSIFYLCGTFYLVWLVFWFWLATEKPALQGRITRRERNYIEDSIGKGVADVNKTVLWVKILTSGPTWAIIFASFSSNYVNYTMLTSLPIFMKEAMEFDIKQNGVLSSLPYITQFLGGIGWGYAADKILQRRWFRVKTVRKMFQFTSLFGVAVLFMILIQLDSRHRHVAVVLLCLSTSVRSLNMGGYAVNQLDLAPRYAGFQFGITNTAGSISGIITPIIAGALTPNKTVEEWRHVFYACSAVCVVGAVAYVILADGELQTWAMSEDRLRDVAVAEREVRGKDGQDHECPRVEMLDRKPRRFWRRQ